MTEELPPLIRGLLHPGAYAHSVEQVLLRETHISWVLLTGQYVYKLKKPVDLGFVDFTTLAKRRHFCEEEMRLNSRYSEGLYLEVVPVTGTPVQPRLGESGEALEYAVKMRQFDEDQLLLRQLETGQLNSSMLVELARALYDIHLSAPLAPEENAWGTPDNIWKPAQANFTTLKKMVDQSSRQQQVHDLESWARQTFEHLNQTWLTRKEEGHIRECHGDLHLGNIVVWSGQVTPFDCIEFNPDLRWIDTISEIAFLVMDLDARQRPDLSTCFLNAYLEASGDYSGLSVLRYYLSYRALVRAKVQFLRQEQIEDKEIRKEGDSDLQKYLDLAQHYSEKQVTKLIITHGVSGSGKTWGTSRLLEDFKAVRIRSDVERKRMFAGSTNRFGEGATEETMYSETATIQTYSRLASLAEQIIQAGYTVIVDATFLRLADRERFRKLAQSLGVEFQIVEFAAEVSVLKDRIQKRARANSDASDATIEVLEKQLSNMEPLTADERCNDLLKMSDSPND